MRTLALASTRATRRGETKLWQLNPPHQLQNSRKRSLLRTKPSPTRKTQPQADAIMQTINRESKLLQGALSVMPQVPTRKTPKLEMTMLVYTLWPFPTPGWTWSTMDTRKSRDQKIISKERTLVVIWNTTSKMAESSHRQLMYYKRGGNS